MRGLRWLPLVAIGIILYGLSLAYRTQKKVNQSTVVEAPAKLPAEVNSTSEKGHWTRYDQKTGCKTVTMYWTDMSQSKDSSHSEYHGITLELYHGNTAAPAGNSDAPPPCEAKFDVVKSASAVFYPSDGRLYSEGDVEITLGEPSQGEPPPNLVSIKSSGVTFDINSGRAETGRPTQFIFKNGEGQATGATYDPPARELFMKSGVTVDWKPVGPNAKPIHIEAPSLEYHEKTSEIDLKPTGRMLRENTVFEGETPVLRLQDDAEGHKIIHEIETGKAHGADTYPNRKLRWEAGHAVVNYTAEGVVEKVTGDGNAKLVSTAETSETTVVSDRVELSFDAQEKESTLSRVNANGHAVVTSKPLPGPGRTPTETHTLRSDAIEMKMRPGGRDIETVVSDPAGELEFIPNLPAQHHRTLLGREMVIAYAANNSIESFRATDVKTTTDPNADDLRRNRSVSTTTSRDLLARFDPRTSRLASMEQSGNFTYQEGDRKAQAGKASLDENQNVMTLDTSAAFSDSTGSTSADHIRMNQATGDFLAEGNVSSVRLPDKDQSKNSQMLSGDAPLQAQANRMETANRNRHTRYEGNAKLWQGANRIQATVVEIDRDKHTLTADGNVVSEFWEQPKSDVKKSGAAAVLTVVRAPHMDYTDQDRLAVYTGGVKLDRAGTELQSRELHAWLADSDADSRLDKAIADGAVDILGNNKKRTYHANSDHAEYYPPKDKGVEGEERKEKLYLNGGAPKIVETVNGKATVTQGKELTYFVSDGRLQSVGGNTVLPSQKK